MGDGEETQRGFAPLRAPSVIPVEAGNACWHSEGHASSWPRNLSVGRVEQSETRRHGECQVRNPIPMGGSPFAKRGIRGDLESSHSRGFTALHTLASVEAERVFYPTQR
jgi:hypothetical protein